MTNHTITLFQYNQKQKPSHKATEKNVVFPSNQCRVVTRKVLGKGMTNFLVPAVLSPGLALRLVDMLKWNIEVDGKFHREAGKPSPEKYTQDEFVQAVWSLACVKPVEIEAA